jgi:membrane protein involved in colicin uptake
VTDADELIPVLDVLDTLEELVGAARRVPLTSNVVLNEEDVIELVDRIRVSLPDDLRAARHALEEREQLMERASREAENLTERSTRDATELAQRSAEEAERAVREARARAEELVADHAITRDATERARTTVAEAERYAAEQREQADAYAREVVTRLAEQLERWLDTVRGGLGGESGGAQTGARGRRQ